MCPGCDLAVQRFFPQPWWWALLGKGSTLNCPRMAAATGRCFSGGASVPAPTDVAEGRNNFEQPFSAFGQPGPRFDQHLESIDAKKKRGNKNHRNFANGIANLDSKAAQQERQEVLGYRTWRILSK